MKKHWFLCCLLSLVTLASAASANIYKSAQCRRAMESSVVIPDSFQLKASSKIKARVEKLVTWGPQAMYQTSTPRTFSIYESSDFPHAKLVVFDAIEIMNSVFNHASFFTERPKPSFAARPYWLFEGVSEVAGHNLSAESLKLYWDFRAPVAGDWKTCNPCSTSTQWWLRMEEEFWKNVILPAIERDRDAYFIAVAKTPYLVAALSHELLHATYHGNPRMREIVKKYWAEQVSSSEKHEFKKRLGFGTSHHRNQAEFLAGYDLANESLVIDEFQAHMLEDNSADAMQSLASLHGPILRALLERENLLSPLVR